jgi:uncharacterized protein (TIGR03083 family)
MPNGAVVEPSAVALTAVLRHSHERLASLVYAVSEDFLSSRSYCPDWSVAQVLSHLGSGAEIALMMLDSALSGVPMDRAAIPPIWDSWNAKSPAQQAADCLTSDDVHIRRLEGLTDAEIGGLRVEFFGMELDAAGLVRMRLSEHAVHTWDVAVSIDPAAVVAPDAVALLMGHLPSVAGRSGRPGAEPFRARLRGSCPDVDLLLDVADEVALVPWPIDGAADGEVSMPSEALLRMVYGRLDPAHTPPFAGDPELLDRARAVFPGF